MLGSQQLSSHQGESSHGGSLSHRTSWHCPRILAVRRQPVQRERGSPQGGAAPLRASSLARPLAVRGSGRCSVAPADRAAACLAVVACSQHCALDDLDDLDAEMGGCEMRCEIELHDRGRRVVDELRGGGPLGGGPLGSSTAAALPPRPPPRPYRPPQPP